MNNYTSETWNSYSRPFISITTSYQLDIYRTVAPLLEGLVADYGCGASKIGPYIMEQSMVDSYTGFDASIDMLRCGEEFLNLQSSRKPFQLIHSPIQKIKPMEFDSGISINSYYTWQEPELCLTSINKTLRTGAKFILITPNDSINMDKLLVDVTKEIGAHPDFKSFCKINKQLVSADSRQFTDLATLLEQCRNAGFNITQVHQKFYDGGLNYLEMTKISD